MRQQIKQLSKVAGPLLVFLFVLASGMSGVIILGKRTLALRAKLLDTKKERVILQERVEELKAFEPQVAKVSEQKIILALPPSDPLLVAVSQIRSLAREQNLFLSNLSVYDSATGPTTDLGSVAINFGLEGSQQDMLNYFEDLLYSVPLMDFITVSVERINNNLEAQVTIRAYWSPYPESLPSVTSPIEPLTQAELEVIDKINGFASLEFEVSSELEAQEPKDKKTSPFSVPQPQEILISEPESQQ